MEEKNEDSNIYTYKTILIGDSYVGKTSLIIRFCDDIFDGSGTATVGIDTKTKFVKRKEKKIELQIWDTAGQERFRSLSKSCCNQMDGIIFVYDIGRKETFKNIKLWRNNIKDVVDFKKVGTVLVGNKCDIETRQVEQEMAEDYAEKNNMSFVEASAKNNINVNEIFTKAIDSMAKLDEESKGAYRRSRSKVGKIISNTSIEEEEVHENKKKNCCKNV